LSTLWYRPGSVLTFYFTVSLAYLDYFHNTLGMFAKKKVFSLTKNMFKKMRADGFDVALARARLD